mmetsp:Transcript_44029/g.115687  ORF Transcript_44029/g.115687 Transcript_44029/m.115687 type:complete len:367 (-) Transcript_44029:577-1677(-)
MASVERGLKRDVAAALVALSSPRGQTAPKQVANLQPEAAESRPHKMSRIVGMPHSLATGNELFALLERSSSKYQDVSDTGHAVSRPLPICGSSSVDGTMTFEHPSIAPSVSGFSDDDGKAEVAQTSSPTSSLANVPAIHAGAHRTFMSRPLAEQQIQHRSAAPAQQQTTDSSDGELIREQLQDARLLTAAAVFLGAVGVHQTLSGLAASQGEAARPALLASMSRILCDECSYVQELDHGAFSRLCQILTLPIEVCAAWQSRVIALQRHFAHVAPSKASNSGMCAADAESDFSKAASANRLYTSTVRRFGRQTVWCTVSLLRRVLHDTEWMEGDRELSNSQAEARLCSMAVALIGRNNMVATVATGW